MIVPTYRRDALNLHVSTHTLCVDTWEELTGEKPHACHRREPTRCRSRVCQIARHNLECPRSRLSFKCHDAGNSSGRGTPEAYRVDGEVDGSARPWVQVEQG